MNHNPYKPPASDVSEAIPERISRPVSVWLLVGLLSLMSGAFGYGVIWSTWMIVTHFDRQRDFGVLVLGISLRLMMLIAAIVVIVNIYRAKSWSRWVGITVLGAFAVWAFYGSDSTHYANEAQSDGGMMARKIIIPMLLGWWIYAVAFSPKARLYFGVEE